MFYRVLESLITLKDSFFSVLLEVVRRTLLFAVQVSEVNTCFLVCNCWKGGVVCLFFGLFFFFSNVTHTHIVKAHLLLFQCLSSTTELFSNFHLICLEFTANTFRVIFLSYDLFHIWETQECRKHWCTRKCCLHWGISAHLVSFLLRQRNDCANICRQLCILAAQTGPSCLRCCHRRRLRRARCPTVCVSDFQPSSQSKF